MVRRIKHIATVGGVGLAAAFVAVFFFGRTESKALSEFAPRIGLSYDELIAMAPRVASQTGATLGTSRHVVYLLACSGLSHKSTLEAQATQASAMARQRHLTDREAVGEVLAQDSGAAGIGSLKGC